MSAKILKPGQSAGIGFAVWMAAACLANAGSAYLPLTGPAALRFEVAMIKPAAAPAIVAVHVEKKEETVPVPMAVISAPANFLEELPQPLSETNTAQTANVEIPSSASFAAHSAADNLLVITPQMLAEYFKPFPNSTNAAGVSVVLPIQVGFTPPTEKNTSSSRATYKVQ